MRTRGLVIGALSMLSYGCGRSGMSLDAAFEARAHAVPVVRDAEPPRTTRVSFGRTRVSRFEFSSGTTLATAPAPELDGALQAQSNLSGFVDAARMLAPKQEHSKASRLLDASALLLTLAHAPSVSEQKRELSFEVNHDHECLQSKCASTLRFEVGDAPPRQAALACIIVNSHGSKFALRMRSGRGVHGSIVRVGDPASAVLFELDGRGGWATTSGGLSTVELAGFSVRRGGAEVAAIELPHAVPNASAWLTGALTPEEHGVVLSAFAAITSMRWPGDTAFRSEDEAGNRG